MWQVQAQAQHQAQHQALHQAQAQAQAQDGVIALQAFKEAIGVAITYNVFSSAASATNCNALIF